MGKNSENIKNVCPTQQFERNHYFYGKLMTVRDFQDEQDYFRGKNALINRLILGWGMVQGLEVSDIQSVEGKLQVNLKQGTALDCWGREIVVSRDLSSIEVQGDNYEPEKFNLVYIEFSECEKERVPVISDANACEENCCSNRIMEKFQLVNTVEETLPEIQIEPITANGGNQSALLRKRAETYYQTKLTECPPCDEPPRILLAIIKGDPPTKHNSTFKIRDLVYNNLMLYELLRQHMEDQDNPHGIDALKSIEGVSSPGGNIDLVQANSITISSDDAADTITIGESHSGETGNPHHTKHEELEEVKAIGGSGPGTDVRDKHVSDNDANRWNSAIFTINEIGPDGNGNFDIEAGQNIDIQAGTHKIIISADATAQAQPKTGKVLITTDSSGKGQSSLIDPRLASSPYCVTLGIDHGDFVEYQIVQFANQILNIKAQVHETGRNKGKFQIVIDTPRLGAQKVSVQWWAIPGVPALIPTVTRPTIPTVTGPTIPTITRPTTTLPTPTRPTTPTPTVTRPTTTLPTLTRPTTPTITRPTIRPGAPGSLTTINGIGTVFEGKLIAAGIRTLEELAAATPQRVADILEFRDLGRASRFIEEAKRLVI